MRYARFLLPAPVLLLIVVLAREAAFTGDGDVAGADADPVIVAAGDIAACGSGQTGDEATAALLAGIAGTVITLGDNVYPNGTASEFANCYNPSWGSHKARTRPASGNHEYNTAGASGYYGYFGAAAGDPTEGYYSYDLGTWHLIALNSECAQVGGCGVGSPQETWLTADLAANTGKNVLAYWHKPRFSSRGNETLMQPIWNDLYVYGADVVLTGHAHLYERFAPLNSAGQPDTTYGIRQFVVGTGGYSHVAYSPVANVEAQNADTFGVLKITLGPSSYTWAFVPEAGKTFADSGSSPTHSAPATPTPAPTPIPCVGACALDFDGANDYVTFGAAPGLSAAAFTLETWFKREGAGVATSTGSGGISDAIPLLTKGRSQGDGSNVDMNYFLGIQASTNRLVADFEEGPGGAGPLGQNHPVVGVTPIANDTWYHAAATYDGTAWKLYLNGVLETQLAVGQPPRSDSIQHAALATAMNSSGVASGFFNGVLDEARVWNYARTGGQIAAAKGVEVTAAGGLIGRWGMNEGLGTAAGDSSGGGAGGVAANGPLWVSGYPLGCADGDGDGWCDSVDGCPSLATGWATPAGDGDCDGFTTGVENAIGTGPGVACGIDAWPVDFDDDAAVTIVDVLGIKPSFNSASPDPAYSARHDLDADSDVDVDDVLSLKPFFGAGCT